eukprot:2157348-Ditylum_brightwellii.AAC.1
MLSLIKKWKKEGAEVALMVDFNCNLVVIKDEMDLVLYLHHLMRFSQAIGTPMTVEPLATLFGQYANTPFAKEFLAGRANTDALNLNKYTTTFLKKLQCKPTDPPHIDTPINAKVV